MQHLVQRLHRKTTRLLALSVAGMACLACAVPIANDLEDSSANQMVLALQRAGTASAKEPDPEHDGKWAVTVAKAEVPRALEVLAVEGLPEPRRPGLSDASAHNSLVPSLHAEQARLLSGASRDIERSLASVDGIVSANVHLALAHWDPLNQAQEPDAVVPGASVLIRYRGGSCPLSTDEVQRIVAGAVATQVDKVQVVAKPASARLTYDNIPRVVSVGPFTVSNESAKLLRFAVGVSVVLNLTTLALLIFYWQKARRRRPAD